MATRRSASKIVATFGVGLAGAYATPHTEAAVISLTPSPEALSWPEETGVRLDFGTGAFTFTQFNDGTGKTLQAYGAFPTYAPDALVGFRLAPASQTITANQAFTARYSVLPTASGTQTFGFLTSSNQVGWIRLDFGGFEGAITYLAAAYNDTPGGTIHSGSLNETAATVPEPGSLALAGLGLLALGSRGVRRLRGKQRNG